MQTAFAKSDEPVYCTSYTIIRYFIQNLSDVIHIRYYTNTIFCGILSPNAPKNGTLPPKTFNRFEATLRDSREIFYNHRQQ